MNIEKIVSHFVVFSLLGLAGYYHSPAIAFAAVMALGVGLARDIYEKTLALREVKQDIPAEVKRTIQDMNARIATLEHGVRTRGF